MLKNPLMFALDKFAMKSEWEFMEQEYRNQELSL